MTPSGPGSIIAAATTGVIVRPFRLPEAIWGRRRAAALVLLSFLPWRDALAGVEQGVDVYLFLIGMMLIAELARSKAFDYLAALAVNMHPVAAAAVSADLPRRHAGDSAAPNDAPRSC